MYSRRFAQSIAGIIFGRVAQANLSQGTLRMLAHSAGKEAFSKQVPIDTITKFEA
jgi:hypothetical protein